MGDVVKLKPSNKKDKHQTVEKKNKKQDVKSSGAKKNVRTINVPTNNKPKLVESGVMRSHNFMPTFRPTMIEIMPLTHKSGRTYEIGNKPICVSAMLKLVLLTIETTELTDEWSILLWNSVVSGEIASNLRDLNVKLTFVRAFEREDNDDVRGNVRGRRRLALFSSEGEDNKKLQNASKAHDIQLIKAIDEGSCVVSFGAEVFVTAPDEGALEEAVDIIRNQLRATSELQGLSYELDINRQPYPYITYGPNKLAKNNHIALHQTAREAATTALYVDSGGDRKPGAEYIGVSKGKHIDSYAAYDLKNPYSLFVGNDTTNQTTTLASTHNEPSQLYLSKVASRAYLLEGKSVVHFVADDVKHVDALRNIPINDNRKVTVDVSQGLLNLLQPIVSNTETLDENRLRARFAPHIDNIIVLLNQFRDVKDISMNDDFANATTQVLTDFFIGKKYWHHDITHHMNEVTLFGTKYSQFAKLEDFGFYITQHRTRNNNELMTKALNELNTIVNTRILTTVPALNTKTSPIIDELVKAQYRIIDLTAMNTQSSSMAANPSVNLMVIAYLNMLLPNLSNGDVIFFHGFSRLSSIAKVIDTIIANSGININVVYTEKNQASAVKTLDTIDHQLDLAMVDVYENRVEQLVEPLGMSVVYNDGLSSLRGSHFIATREGIDYILLDSII